jgi:hypothetical protein
VTTLGSRRVRHHHEPGNRSAAGRPSSPRVGRHPRAGAAVLVVPGNGADAEDPRVACPTARGKGRGVEPVEEDASPRGRDLAEGRAEAHYV